MRSHQEDGRRVRNESNSRMAKVGKLCKKVQDRMLNWYGDMREEEYIGKRVRAIYIHGRRNEEGQNGLVGLC